MKPKTLCLFLKLSLLAAVHAKITTPNLVLIFTDDQGYGDLSCFGSSKIKTPNIDRIAKEGRKFTSFMVASRFALLLGPLF